MSPARSIVLLTADDYALSEGVSEAIGQLAARRLLSAAGVMVTMRHWPAQAQRIAALRDRIAVGLHLNLTLGAPLGPMARTAPEGRLPDIGRLTTAALSLRIERAEIEAETSRQLDAFEAGLGVLPDYVDGHQHAHALPCVRDGVLAAIGRRRWPRPPLVRDPAGRAVDAVRMRNPKAALLAGLSAGFARRARRSGLVVNDSFAGVTDFRPGTAAAELAAGLDGSGRLHIAMCHPGFPDAELEAIDPVTVRRRSEYDALLAMAGLEERIWHPRRSADGPPVDWLAELAGP